MFHECRGKTDPVDERGARATVRNRRSQDLPNGLNLERAFVWSDDPVAMPPQTKADGVRGQVSALRTPLGKEEIGGARDAADDGFAALAQ